MLHTFNGPYYTKNDEYMKNMITVTFFHVFLIFCVAESVESMKRGHFLDEELNFHPTSTPA